MNVLAYVLLLRLEGVLPAERHLHATLVVDREPAAERGHLLVVRSQRVHAGRLRSPSGGGHLTHFGELRKRRRVLFYLGLAIGVFPLDVPAERGR